LIRCFARIALLPAFAEQIEMPLDQRMLGENLLVNIDA